MCSSDLKKTASSQIKLLVGTLIETEESGEGNTSLALPKAKMNKVVNGFKLVNFSRAFATVISKLSNSMDVYSFLDKLSDLAKKDSSYVRLLRTLKGDENATDRKIKFENLSKYDWRLLVSFITTFNKQQPDAYITKIDGKDTYIRSANTLTAVDDTIRSWKQNLIQKSKDKSGTIALDRIDTFNSPGIFNYGNVHNLNISALGSSDVDVYISQNDNGNSSTDLVDINGDGHSVVNLTYGNYMAQNIHLSGFNHSTFNLDISNLIDNDYHYLNTNPRTGATQINDMIVSTIDGLNYDSSLASGSEINIWYGDPATGAIGAYSGSSIAVPNQAPLRGFDAVLKSADTWLTNNPDHFIYTYVNNFFKYLYIVCNNS